jgi:hypothetical protein
MADTIRQVEYYYTLVPDRPGEGVRIFSGLKDEGVNLLAACGFPVGRGKLQADFVPEDPDLFKKAAKKLGLKLSAKKRGFLVQGDDRAGALAEVLDALARSRVNVHAAQAVSAGAGRWAMMLWVNPKDQAKARKAFGI